MLAVYKQLCLIPEIKLEIFRDDFWSTIVKPMEHRLSHELFVLISSGLFS